MMINMHGTHLAVPFYTTVVNYSKFFNAAED